MYVDTICYDLISDENELFNVSMSIASGKITSEELSEWLKRKSKAI